MMNTTHSLLRIVLAGGLGAGTLLASGCASDGPGQSAEGDAETTETHDYMSGMMCPSCETTWVTESSSFQGPRNLRRFNSKRQMTCPTCETTARQVLLADGDVQMHECPTCKVTPTLLQPDPRPDPRAFQGGRGVR